MCPEYADGLATLRYSTLESVAGPLIIVNGVRGVAYDETVEITMGDGTIRTGQVLEVEGDTAVVQVYEGTSGIDVDATSVRFLGKVAQIGVSPELLGRVLNGAGQPIDGGKPIVSDELRDINGAPINPIQRDEPSDFIETGVSAIDGLNTLVRGQKLPIFTGSGLPANELAALIVRQARVLSGEQFAIVFAAMGITNREAAYFIESFRETGALGRVVLFENLADDPTVERILTPRCALTVAEYLAFTCEMQVLVVLSDMTNYCEALREISTAREEVPGRRGYPGYLYTDLSTIYERAGRIKGSKGSITQLPIVSMPDDDITHPIPDLTGYITEGQIVLSRALHRRSLFPPIDVLPCLSRLMNSGIGEGKTREDHSAVANQLYSAYARGSELRRLVAIIGEDSLSAADRTYLHFAARFEEKFVAQGATGRTIQQTLDLGWELLTLLPKEELNRVRDFIDKYYPEDVAEQERAAAEEKAQQLSPEEADAERFKQDREHAARATNEVVSAEAKTVVNRGA